MKYIKTYEALQFDPLNPTRPRLGDYVICYESEVVDELKSFIHNNIGIIKTKSSQYSYLVEYENIPDNLKMWFPNDIRMMSEFEMKYWSDNKEDLEHIISQNKYNL